jgi:hypothetical protein
VQSRSAKLLLVLLALTSLASNCPAPDSVSLRILTETGSRVALEDPLTFNAGTIYQGLSALGHTDKTPRAERTTTDNKAFPATLESMTVASWPLHPGLAPKSIVSQPDDLAMMTRLLPGLTSKANEALTAAGLISRRFRIRTSSSRSFSAWSGSGRRPSRRMCSGPAYGRRR